MLAPAKFVLPCIPTAAKAIPQGDAWLHEPKLDGYRFQIVKHGRAVRLYSRNGHEWTKRLAGLAEALQVIPRRAVVLDAELCFPEQMAAPTSEAWDSLRRRPGRRANRVCIRHPALGRHGPNALSRRPLLERLLAHATIPGLLLVPTFDDGMELLTAAEQHDWRGRLEASRFSTHRCPARAGMDQSEAEAWRGANRDRWRTFQSADFVSQPQPYQSNKTASRAPAPNSFTPKQVPGSAYISVS